MKLLQESSLLHEIRNSLELQFFYEGNQLYSSYKIHFSPSYDLNFVYFQMQISPPFRALIKSKLLKADMYFT